MRQGIKRVARDNMRLSIEAGQAVMVPSGQAFDLVDTPIDGRFVATMLVPSPRIIDEVATQFPEAQEVRSATPIRFVEPELLQAFDRAFEAVTDPNHLPKGVVENREQEVLVWLAHKGFRFSGDGKLDLAQKLRRIVLQDLGRDWKATEVAEMVSMSEATLRRRLRDQGISFQQLLIDVRMTRALALLQTTDLSVGVIALDVGYDSPSRFTARFKQRFALAPSAIRAKGKDH
ncbi:MAG: helix-turn-helix transcriptional regulator [Actinomycetota bacterium]|nr:helix-turn-helix transcriptional regulator [Actinomycetota bacterium]